MGFRSRPRWTVPTLLLHLALSLSSLEFRIPSQRIKEGSRIWPEYRLHSVVFAARSLAAMALYWYEQAHGITEPCYPISAVLVLATMAAADLSTASQMHQSKSIRDLDIARATRYFFTVCQFYASAGVLMGVRRYTIQFLNVWIVQLNPFLMTLRRKKQVVLNCRNSCMNDGCFLSCISSHLSPFFASTVSCPIMALSQSMDSCWSLACVLVFPNTSAWVVLVAFEQWRSVATWRFSGARAHCHCQDLSAMQYRTSISFGRFWQSWCIMSYDHCRKLQCRNEGMWSTRAAS